MLDCSNFGYVCARDIQMQFTESEIQEILQENQMLKKDLIEAREELEATNKLYDTMVVGTRNLLLLVEEGSRGAVYVSPNVEDALGLPRELVMSDVRELGPRSGDIPCEEMFGEPISEHSGRKSADESADEMLAIMEDRERWIQKKTAEYYNSKYNELLYYGIEKEPEAEE